MATSSRTPSSTTSLLKVPAGRLENIAYYCVDTQTEVGPMLYTRLAIAKILIQPCVIAALSLVMACAGFTQELIYHSITILNKGTEMVSDVTVIYGGESTKFENAYKTNGMSGDIGERRFNPEMTIIWHTSNSQEHRQTIPIKLKNTTPRKLDALEIQFTDDGLELYQGVAIDKYSTDYTRIYPE